MSNMIFLIFLNPKNILNFAGSMIHNHIHKIYLTILFGINY